MYIASTFFNEKTWEDLGSNWLNKAKRLRLSGIIIVSNFSEENKKKVQAACSSNNFSVVESLSGDPVDIFCSLASNLKNERCLFSLPTIDPTLKLSETRDALCKTVSAEPIKMIRSIMNLNDRVNAINSIDEIKKKYGGILCSDSILGTADFWKSFAGFQLYLKKRSFFESYFDPFYMNLSLNLFFSNADSFSLETYES